MIPERLIEMEGMSIITAIFYGMLTFATGYIFNEFKNYKECQKKYLIKMDKRISTTEKCIAVMKERDSSIKESIDELKSDIGKLFAKMEQVRVEVASIKK